MEDKLDFRNLVMSFIIGNGCLMLEKHILLEVLMIKNIHLNKPKMDSFNLRFNNRGRSKSCKELKFNFLSLIKMGNN
jgi:hypothetical protein